MSIASVTAVIVSIFQINFTIYMYIGGEKMFHFYVGCLVACTFRGCIFFAIFKVITLHFLAFFSFKIAIFRGASTIQRIALSYYSITTYRHASKRVNQQTWLIRVHTRWPCGDGHVAMVNSL